MFSVTGIRLPRGNRTGLSVSSPFASSRYNKGTVFMTLSGLLLISGSIMAILGFNNVFGDGITMLGMLMIAVSVLLLLFATRQFLVAKKMRKAERTMQITHGAVAAMVIEREDEMVGTFTVVMDTVNVEARRRSSEDCLPPDYTEATSDFYPESMEDLEDPPPPYRPPTYDETMFPKEHYPGEVMDDTLPDGEQEVGGEMNEDELNVSHVSEYNAQEVTHFNQEPEQHIAHGYQDLPTVTI